VRDRFGEYGICGFYAFRRGEKPVLEHFLFSCRVLQMGVEQTIHASLGSPTIDSTDAAALATFTSAFSSPPDWVTLRHDDGPTADASAAGTNGEVVQHRYKLTLIGPCELTTIDDIVRHATASTIAVESDLMFRTEGGHNIAHFGHHAFMRLASQPEIASEYASDLARVPWFDKRLLNESYFANEDKPGVILVSAVRNAQCADYRHRSGKFSVPCDYYRIGNLDITKRENRDQVFPFLNGYIGKTPPEFLDWFAENFEFTGPIGEEAYAAHLAWLVDALPSNKRLVLLNVTDPKLWPPNEEPEDSRADGVVNALAAHHEMINRTIAACAKAHPDKVAVIDINEAIPSPDDMHKMDPNFVTPSGRKLNREAILTYTYYHYSRRVYVNVASKLLEVLGAWGWVEQDALERARARTAQLPPQQRAWELKTADAPAR
jgi:hypothetical protein